MLLWRSVVTEVISQLKTLELEREMKIYMHDAASFVGFNLMTEQEGVFSKALFPSTGFGKSLLHFTAQIVRLLSFKIS